MDVYEFSAELWLWDARKPDSWTFVTVPADESEAIRESTMQRPRAGFGSVRVTVTIGSTSWQTSVFPDKAGSYVLPIKKQVRRSEEIEAGDMVTVRIEVED